MTILEFLRNNSISGPFACGGMGRCGKCRIKLTKKDLPVTEADKKFLNVEDISKGVRLACMSQYLDDIDLNDIEILWEKEVDIVSESMIAPDGQLHSDLDTKNDQFGFAIDIGTTTIAACLVNLTRGIVMDESTCINRGRSLGADVISRISAANNGKLKELQGLLCEDLNSLFTRLISRNKINPLKITKLIIAGNTTMEHILLGYDCSTLGKFPFKAYSLDIVETNALAIFNNNGLSEAKLSILPGISAFIGADIVSGLSYIDIMSKDKVALFLDLGTNGEMALGCKDKILLASTAAGPAFEACNIKHGIASVPGAICDVNIPSLNRRPSIKTIMDRTPLGICGSGLISAVASMKNVGLIDSDGKLKDEYFEAGYPLVGNIKITQSDIRELQKAKSAIRAGIDILFEEYGITFEDVDKVYLAGGFGKALNVSNAIDIGILPKEFSHKTEAIGNSSLKGAIKYLYKDDIRNLNTICHTAKEITLANMANFNDKFLKYMNF